MQEIISGKVLVEKLKNQKFAAQEVSLINTITKILQSNLQENQYKKDQVTHNNFINNQEIILLDPIQGSVQTQTNEENPPSNFFSKIKKALKFSKRDNPISRDESDPNSDKTTGINVLTFDGVELYRVRNDKVTFETIGTLRVVYFPDYFQFVLYLNDWRYVLLKELPILKYCTNCSDSNVYYFKSKDAIVYVKFPQVFPVESIQNFDTILEHNSVLLKNEEELEEIKLQGKLFLI